MMKSTSGTLLEIYSLDDLVSSEPLLLSRSLSICTYPVVVAPAYSEGPKARLQRESVFFSRGVGVFPVFFGSIAPHEINEAPACGTKSTHQRWCLLL